MSVSLLSSFKLGAIATLAGFGMLLAGPPAAKADSQLYGGDAVFFYYLLADEVADKLPSDAVSVPAGLESMTGYTSPLTPELYYPDEPFTDPEGAVQFKARAGRLSRLKVRVAEEVCVEEMACAFEPMPTMYTVTVRINGEDTALSCTIEGAGTCTTPTGVVVDIDGKSLLSVAITTDFGLISLSQLIYRFIWQSPSDSSVE